MSHITGMAHSDSKWDTRTAETDLYDLIHMEFEEVMAVEGSIGIPEETLCSPEGFVPRKRKSRSGWSRPKKFIPVDLNEIE